MRATTIRFVYFDLDDTLLDHRRAERRGLADVHAAHREAFAHVPRDVLQETYHRHSAALWGAYGQGQINREVLQRQRFQQTFEALAVEGLDPRALDAQYLACYARHWTFVDGAQEAFHRVADRYPVGLLTNGFAEVQRAKLERFPDLAARARATVISEEVGALKPHPRLFAHAAGVADTPPAQILYVGDSYRSDVQGALQAGWQMAWFTREEETPAEAEGVWRFHHWPDLVAALAP